MQTTKTWQPGDVIAYRGIYNRRVSYIQAAVIVQDRPEEIALAILPGAECYAPQGYIHGKHGASGHWDRWGDYEKGDWNMERYTWHTNRLLILLQPETYYSSFYFWQAEKNQFLCYYINFQLPFRRTAIGLDTFDLELDLIVEPDYQWHWKDVEEYQHGIACGILRQEWVREIEAAQPKIFTRLAKRLYPYDGAWLNWRPDPEWLSPTLPENWDKIYPP